MGYTMNVSRMDEIIAALGETYRIYAPKKVGKFIRYGEVKSVAEIVFDEKSHFSPKEVFYPIVQTLLYFSENDVRESEVDPRPVIVFLRPCDVNGIHRLDTIFLENGKQADNFYQRLRQKVTFFLMECCESFETCFCVSMNSAATDDYAVAVGKREDKLCVEVKDEAFAPYFSAEESRDFTPAFVTENKRTVTVPEIERSMVKDIHALDMWREFDDNCIGCGGCNTVCITCSCFDTTDNIYNETSRDGERRRVWSSCMLGDYCTVAGGHNVRAKAGDRMRFKAMHKLFDYNARFGKGNMCVGCGRCDMRCPKDIHFSETIDKLAAAVETLKEGKES